VVYPLRVPLDGDQSDEVAAVVLERDIDWHLRNLLFEHGLGPYHLTIKAVLVKAMLVDMIDYTKQKVKGIFEPGATR
jgi:hypothetical protein